MQRRQSIATQATPFFSLLLAGLVTSSGCGISAPNDPQIAILCDEGYILSPNGTSCLKQELVRIYGIVTNVFTQLPIEGVEVVVYPDGPDPQITDSAGYFSLTGYTTEDIYVGFFHDDYRPVYQAAEDEDIGVGGVVLRLNVQLTPYRDQATISGTVYAGDHPAVGARIILRNDSTGNYDAETQADGNGHFSFPDVEYYTYRIRIPPYDDDNDGVYDYRFFEYNLGDIETTNINITNLVFPLTPIIKQLLYTNLLNAGVPRNMQNGNVLNTVLVNPTDNLLFHFGAEVDTNTVDVVLYPWETAGGLGDVIPVATTWSMDETVLTIDPSVDLIADALAATGYELHFNAFHWADGSVAIAQNDPTQVMIFRFDVSSGPGVLVSPTPSVYIDNKVSHDQVAARLSCDARVCWILDADDFFFNGWADPTPTATADAFFSAGDGFQLTWDRSESAVDYNVYVRQRNDNGTDIAFGNWYLVSANLDLEAGVLDPSLPPTVFASNVMDIVGGFTDWADFGVLGAGPLSFGGQIDIVVTAIDTDGFESSIDSSLGITLADVTPASLQTVVVPYAGTDPQDNPQENGATFNSNVRLNFSEYLEATVNPELAITSGMVVSMGQPDYTSWDPTDPLTPRTANDSLVLGPMAFRVKGSCSEALCDADFNAADAAQSDDSICVQDASLFAGGDDVVFVTAGGVLRHAHLTIGTVDSGIDILTFTAPVANNIVTGDFVCNLSATTTTTTSVAYTTPTAPAEFDVGVASGFHTGQDLFIYDTVGGIGETAAIDYVLAGSVNRLISNGPLANNYPIGAFIFMRPTNGEYAFRPVETASLRFDSQATAVSIRLDFDLNLTSTMVMERDLVLIDVDGELLTVDDRYFGVVAELIMQPDQIAVGDQSDYHIILGVPPVGLPAVPPNTRVQPGITLVLMLGDSFAITNAGSLVDSSGNLGLSEYRDQFSRCTVGAYCSGGYFIY